MCPVNASFLDAPREAKAIQLRCRQLHCGSLASQEGPLIPASKFPTYLSKENIVLFVCDTLSEDMILLILRFAFDWERTESW